MQRLEVSGAVRHKYMSLGVKGFSAQYFITETQKLKYKFFISCDVSTQFLVTAYSYGASRSYSDTPQSVGLLWTSDQLVAETST
jgi:hypothetical protein